MRVFIILSFLFLGWLYWELSDGSAFEPEAPPGAVAEAPPEPAEPPATAPAEAEVEALAAAAEVPAPAPEEPAAPAPPAAEVEVTRGDASLDTIAAAASRPLPEAPSVPLAPVEALAALAPDLARPVGETVEAALAEEGAAALRQVTGDRVNMRAGPGTGFEVVGQLTAGQMAEVLEADGNWLRVRGEDGAEGWMSARFLAPASRG